MRKKKEKNEDWITYEKRAEECYAVEDKIYAAISEAHLTLPEIKSVLTGIIELAEEFGQVTINRDIIRNHIDVYTT